MIALYGKSIRHLRDLTQSRLRELFSQLEVDIDTGGKFNSHKGFDYLL